MYVCAVQIYSFEFPIASDSVPTESASDVKNRSRVLHRVIDDNETPLESSESLKESPAVDLNQSSSNALRTSTEDQETIDEPSKLLSRRSASIDADMADSDTVVARGRSSRGPMIIESESIDKPQLEPVDPESVADVETTETPKLDLLPTETLGVEEAEDGKDNDADGKKKKKKKKKEAEEEEEVIEDEDVCTIRFSFFSSHFCD
jgi:hypothetical protein